MTTPPDAAQRPHTHSLFGTDRDDLYHWLRDRDDPDVLAYLAAENAYAAEMTVPTGALEDALYGEIVARVVPGRRLGAGLRPRLLGLPPLRDRRGVPDLRPPIGHDGRSRGGPH